MQEGLHRTDESFAVGAAPIGSAGETLLTPMHAAKPRQAVSGLAPTVVDQAGASMVIGTTVVTTAKPQALYRRMVAMRRFATAAYARQRKQR
jgi:hypothetical protein